MRYAVLCLALSGCASVAIPDFKGYITLPASGDGYYVQTVSEGEGRIPKAEWDKLKARGVVVLSEDWAILKKTVVSNCLSNTCKDAVGIFDALFYTIDDAFKKANALKAK